MAGGLEKYKRFAYRGCPGMCCFNVAESFIYMITETYISQIPRHTSLACTQEISCRPISTIIHDNLIYIASATALAYFDGELHEICLCEPLSVSFVAGEFVFTVTRNGIIAFSAEEKKVKSKLTINGVNGCCTSAYSSGDTVLLGYETGKVYFVENLENCVGECGGNSLEGQQIADLEEPIISIAAVSDYTYISTISGKIVRIEKCEETFIYTETASPIKKILFFEDLLIGFENCSILFYNTDLKLLHSFVEYFKVIDVFVVEKSLYVGYSIGLVVEYDIYEIIRNIKHKKYK